MADRDDRVLPATLALSLAIIPFLLVAWVVLYLFPDDTERLFAWPVKPRMSPMVLGSVYLGGAYFFLRAARASQWHQVKAGFVPVGTFASLMGVATVIHWDRFTHDHLAFWLWAGLYFTTPFLVFGVWAANRGHDSPVTDDDLLLPRGARLGLAGAGALALGTSTLLFLAPDRLRASWPWMLTPLTARVMGAIFALGIGGFIVARDGRWSATRVMLEVQGVMLGLILLAGIRSHADLNLAKPLTITLVLGLGATLAGGAVLYVRMNRRAQAGP
ncbi:MAG: hypothetical protein ABIS47_10990 [Acidimicrobiales bacterium]